MVPRADSPSELPCGGNLYAVDASRHHVVQFAPGATTPTRVFAPDTPAHREAFLHVALDNECRLYVFVHDTAYVYDGTSFALLGGVPRAYMWAAVHDTATDNFYLFESTGTAKTSGVYVSPPLLDTLVTFHHLAPSTTPPVGFDAAFRRIYLVNGSEVSVYSATMRFQRSFAMTPQCFATTPGKMFAVVAGSDPSSRRIAEFAPFGSGHTSYAYPGIRCNLVTFQDKVYFPAGNGLAVLNPADGSIAPFGAATNVGAFAFDALGSVYAANATPVKLGGTAIREYAPDGTTLTRKLTGIAQAAELVLAP